MNQADKSRGPPRAAVAMARFQRTMSVCGFIDMEFVGSRFTWSNRYTKERLDQGFQNTQWRSKFPFSRVITLSPNESDHCPPLIEVSGANAVEDLGHKIKCAGNRLMTWHLTEFDKQKVEMRIIQEKINDIMKQPFSPQQYEEQLTLHVSQLLTQQEKYWRQRSQTLWLRDGDRNSAFFHRSSNNRKSRNTIKGLRDEDGEWQAAPTEIQHLLMNYFKDVFSTNNIDFEAVRLVLEATPRKVI
ncbi:uncharacterized protein LOC133730889 [Rosa rugosa]|uniref:uncharacterized protein LOC133730889 n=1 Tax=Rosa rugosa TaxID=74645 RepID=UPI002B417D1C|nr:uncharacterized protein LOC133730889 [Rosa rugosa]